MGFLHVRITNPRPTGCSYGWYPNGLHLAGNQSIDVDFDPFTTIPVNSGYLQMLKQQLIQGQVKFEYWVEAPCTTIQNPHLRPAKPAVAVKPPLPPQKESLVAIPPSAPKPPPAPKEEKPVEPVPPLVNIPPPAMPKDIPAEVAVPAETIPPLVNTPPLKDAPERKGVISEVVRDNSAEAPAELPLKTPEAPTQDVDASAKESAVPEEWKGISRRRRSKRS